MLIVALKKRQRRWARAPPACQIKATLLIHANKLKVMLGLISIIVNGCDNTGFSAKQGNRCIRGEMASSIKKPNTSNPH